MSPTEQEEPKQRKSVSGKLSRTRIIRDPGLQVRGLIQPSRVESYADIIREHGSMDPLELYCFEPLNGDLKINKETKFYLSDGFHRDDAYEKCGIDEVPVIVRMGSRSDAITSAIKKNGHHGERMNNQEKRHAASVAVLDPEIGNMTDLAIAKLIGCSPSLVASARRGETQQDATARVSKAKGKSSAPQATIPVTAHKRRAPGSAKPSKAMALKAIEEYINSEILDESDVVALFDCKGGSYKMSPDPGEITTLRVVSKNGREQVNVKVIVKSIDMVGIVLKSEDQKLSVAE